MSNQTESSRSSGDASSLSPAEERTVSKFNAVVEHKTFELMNILKSPPNQELRWFLQHPGTLNPEPKFEWKLLPHNYLVYGGPSDQVPVSCPTRLSS